MNSTEISPCYGGRGGGGGGGRRSKVRRRSKVKVEAVVERESDASWETASNRPDTGRAPLCTVV